MRHLILTAPLLLAAAAASARELPLPVPPIPPAGPPSVAAPMPDMNIIDRFTGTRSSVVTLDTGINQRGAPDLGLGYGPGAHYQTDRNQRWLTLPGILLHVPLP